jgi:methionyl-tRNA formyltransferase
MNKKVLFFGRKKCNQSKKALLFLKSLNFIVTYIESSSRSEKIPKITYEWKGDYIFCFRSLFILPENIINRAKIAAINFHPGPPEYPGSGCINFALFEESKKYGVTAHLMNESIDSGEILSCKRFPIIKNDNLESLLTRTHKELFILFTSFISNLDRVGHEYINELKNKNKKEKWSGKARRIKELNSLQIIDKDTNREDLEKIIRATYTKEFPPKIILYGYEFLLSKPD